MPTKNLTPAEEAYELLKDVPAQDWITGYYSHEIECKCCAMGHLKRLQSDDPNNYDPTYWKDDYEVPVFVFSQLFIDGGLIACNDSEDPELDLYPQPTPKERVLALLKDMIQAGY